MGPQFVELGLGFRVCFPSCFLDPNYGPLLGLVGLVRDIGIPVLSAPY